MKIFDSAFRLVRSLEKTSYSKRIPNRNRLRRLLMEQMEDRRLLATIDLAALTATQGTTIFGADPIDLSGWFVSGTGDVNGDGFDDLIIGAVLADASGNAKPSAGESYVIFGGDVTELVTHLGNSSSETLTGTAAANIMIGGRGNDTLIGNGGADVLTGGQGNDILAVSDLAFKRIVGGTGIDTIRLDGSGLFLNLTTLADNRLLGIESIDITGVGNNTLTLNQREVLNLSDESNTLIVRRNAGDVVNFGIGWTQAADQTIGTDTFNVYLQGAATLKVAVADTPPPTVSNAPYYKGSFYTAGGTNIEGGFDPSKHVAKAGTVAQTLSFENVSNYTRGINGLVIDVPGLTATSLTVADLGFRMSPQGAFDEAANPPSGWTAAPAPTATGFIEGACRHVIKDRKERSGMRWKEKGAQSMLNLRCIEASELWDVVTEQHRVVSLSKFGGHRKNYCDDFLTMAS